MIGPAVTCEASIGKQCLALLVRTILALADQILSDYIGLRTALRNRV